MEEGLSCEEAAEPRLWSGGYWGASSALLGELHAVSWCRLHSAAYLHDHPVWERKVLEEEREEGVGIGAADRVCTLSESPPKLHHVLHKWDIADHDV